MGKGAMNVNENRLGRRTLLFPSAPSVLGFASAVGKKEGEGPLSAFFDYVDKDDTFGEKSWEKSETALQQRAILTALSKANRTPEELQLLFAGDLLNQCIGSSYAARGIAAPFLGLYGACSTMAESLLLAAMAVDGGYAALAAAAASSHFCTAERQYRTPLEYGGQRTPTAQWTVTGAGAVLLGPDGPGPYVTCATVGVIQDKGIQDANNMGAAMAPAAYDTLKAHFADTGRSPADYDLIVTGDLGSLGKRIVADFFQKDGRPLGDTYQDCGVLIFDPEKQDVHCGGSGCGCSASVLGGYLLRGMRTGQWNRILFCGTGALHSPVSVQQGESIPGICHAVALQTTRPAPGAFR